jgi:hypothetical protein
MLTAVQFDNQRFLETDEVDDERTNGVLSAEFVSGQASVLEMEPEASFCIGLVFPEFADTLFHFMTLLHFPSFPSPSFSHTVLSARSVLSPIMLSRKG